ncbi:hypothetical protein ATL39_0058 [Sinobaca qinghaiensis]|uniref:Uncharacterized protein n=1 Tax=Sinobaca qinghaiensis TaxID=342944 RepID=A0A419VTZ5_9BACL|nr:hypothetical protein [Sinobaca qinghaiensis]RKD84125.1 hypothetical protein ATL39_0058 [Sinobaca qinghaiensis]
MANKLVIKPTSRSRSKARLRARVAHKSRSKSNLAEEYFVDGMFYTMMNEFSLSEEKSSDLINKYKDKIDFNSETVQHLGPSYYTEKILMKEKVIDYKPM